MKSTKQTHKKKTVSLSFLLLTLLLSFFSFCHQLHPRVVWSPSFACTVQELSDKVDVANLKVSQASTLVIEGGGVVIQGLELKGTLRIRDGRGANVLIKNLKVENKGWEWKPLDEAAAAHASEEERMRGFSIIKHETREIEFAQPGDYVVES